MLGIPVSGPAFIYGDNESVLCNTTIPESTISKKHYYIAYHVVRGGVAKEEWITGYISSHLNYSDTLTKTVPSGEKRDYLIGHYLDDMS